MTLSATARQLAPGPVLVTGAAGFIGMHTTQALLDAGVAVVGLDRIDGPGPVALREARLRALHAHAARGPLGAAAFRFVRTDIALPGLADRLAGEAFDRIVHLAAQAGVRRSIEHPAEYTHSNLVGTAAMLELARIRGCRHFVYASSSSVYGGRTEVPFRETDRIDRPSSYYAATKAANETMAASYAHLFALPVTGLRFFTVYGPWGRPDMAPWLFTEAMLADRPIRVFAGGTLQRDFTYVDDIVRGVIEVLARPPRPPAGQSPIAVYNIGNHRPVTVNAFIDALQHATGRTARRLEEPMQPGDVPVTCADITALHGATGFAPSTPLATGLERFVRWFRQYHDGATQAPDAAAGGCHIQTTPGGE